MPVRPGRQVISPGSVAIRGKTIVAVGGSGEIDAAFSTAEVIDCRGRLVMPGFVDCHVHAGMGLPKAAPSGLPAAARWKGLVGPRLRGMGEEDTFAAVCHSCLELIRAGVTTFADVCIDARTTAAAVEKMGQRVVLAPAQQDVSMLEEEIRALRSCGCEEIEPAIASRSSAAAPAVALERASVLAREAGLPIHVSAAELGAEGMMRLRQAGLLTERTILAHGAHAPQSAAELILGAGARLVYNPFGTGRQGAATNANYRDKAARIGLGTEDADASGRHDMFEAMRLAVVTSRLDESATPLDAWDALEMATLGGASVLGMEERSGSLEPGKQADMIVIDLDRTHFAPLQENGEADLLAAHLVFSAGVGDVDSVIVAGKPVMRGRLLAVADESTIIAAAQDAADRLFHSARVA